MPSMNLLSFEAKAPQYFSTKFSIPMRGLMTQFCTDWSEELYQEAGNRAFLVALPTDMDVLIDMHHDDNLDWLFS